jgi:uncharacterized membrane protein
LQQIFPEIFLGKIKLLFHRRRNFFIFFEFFYLQIHLSYEFFYLVNFYLFFFFENIFIVSLYNKNMKETTKRLLIAGFSGAVGGATGSVSGSNSWIIVGVVSAVIAIIVAWLISGFVK